MNRTINTLFMLMSVDGKISTGDVDERDVDKDFTLISGIKEGLSQYYELEKMTDFFSLNTGRVMAKIGVNDRTEEPKKCGASFVIVDNKPHLTKRGVDYMKKWAQHLYLVTTNAGHPALNDSEVTVFQYDETIDFSDMFQRLKRDHNAERVTVQSGGTLNAVLLRAGLIDSLSIVVAPAIIGGGATSTLVDGASLRTQADLQNIKVLKLIKCDVLENSYLHLQYELL